MTEKAKTLRVSAIAIPVRLDIFLTKKLGLSRSKIQTMISQGGVMVDGKLPKKAGDLVKSGMKIKFKSQITIPTITRKASPAQPLPKVEVIAETPEYIIINKPAGLLVHETDAHEAVTLAHWLLKRWPELRGIGEKANRPGIVHRLDKEASGVIVIAKTQAMFAGLKKQFETRTVEKEYLALVHGKISADHGVIDFPIDRGQGGRMVARPKTDRLKVRNVPHIKPGKASLTEFFVAQRFTRFTLLRVRIHTGRTHQIRVHMFASDHPVVGDELYVNKKLEKKNDQTLGRLWLHASRLCFTDGEGKLACYEAELPKKLTSFLHALH